MQRIEYTYAANQPEVKSEKSLLVHRRENQPYSLWNLRAAFSQYSKNREQSTSRRIGRSPIRMPSAWNKKLMPVCRERRCCAEGKTKAASSGKGRRVSSTLKACVYVYKLTLPTSEKRERGHSRSVSRALSPSRVSRTFFLSCLRTMAKISLEPDAARAVWSVIAADFHTTRRRRRQFALRRGLWESKGKITKSRALQRLFFPDGTRLVCQRIRREFDIGKCVHGLPANFENRVILRCGCKKHAPTCAHEIDMDESRRGPIYVA